MVPWLMLFDEHFIALLMQFQFLLRFYLRIQFFFWIEAAALRIIDELRIINGALLGGLAIALDSRRTALHDQPLRLNFIRQV